MTATEIIRAVRELYHNQEYKLNNTYWYGWEADFGCISSNGYITEVEVKISRSDFWADFKKVDKHRYLANHRAEALLESKYPFYSLQEKARDEFLARHLTKEPYEFYLRKDKEGPSSHVSFCKPSNRIPNRFYYACPKDLIGPDEVPKYAGLYYYVPNPLYPQQKLTEVKPAPFLHKEQHDKRDMLLGKYYAINNNYGNSLYYIKEQLWHHLDEEGKLILENVIKKASV
jgi:hypothetical protein